MGDHSLVCRTGGERIARHNALKDAIHDTAAPAGLAPRKEGRALLPGTNQKPADIFIPGWAGGRDAALDVMVTHPLKSGTRARPPSSQATPSLWRIREGVKKKVFWGLCLKLWVGGGPGSQTF